MDATHRQLTALTRPAALRLIAGASLGRVVFTQRALPAVQPVTHIVDDDDIVIRSPYGAALVPAEQSGVVVAYEADAIDPDTRLGWSVTVTGTARPICDPADIARYERILPSWLAGGRDQLLRITPYMVSGYRLEHIAATVVLARAGELSSVRK
jgi:hypothetical protein